MPMVSTGFNYFLQRKMKVAVVSSFEEVLRQFGGLPQSMINLYNITYRQIGY